MRNVRGEVKIWPSHTTCCVYVLLSLFEGLRKPSLYYFIMFNISVCNFTPFDFYLESKCHINGALPVSGWTILFWGFPQVSILFIFKSDAILCIFVLSVLFCIVIISHIKTKKHVYMKLNNDMNVNGFCCSIRLFTTCFICGCDKFSCAH